MASLPATFPWGLGGDEAAAASASSTNETFRLAQYLKGKTNVEALLDSLGTHAEELADLFTSLDVDRRIENAFGWQLDILGEIIGQTRQGASDDVYRDRLTAGVLLNNASGTVEEIYKIFELIIPDGASLSLTDFPPAAFVLFVGSEAVDETTASRLALFLRRARAAGVHGTLHWSPAAAADTFTFDGTAAQAFDVGQFAGAVL